MVSVWWRAGAPSIGKGRGRTPVRRRPPSQKAARGEGVRPGSPARTRTHAPRAARGWRGRGEAKRMNRSARQKGHLHSLFDEKKKKKSRPAGTAPPPPSPLSPPTQDGRPDRQRHRPRPHQRPPPLPGRRPPAPLPDRRRLDGQPVDGAGRARAAVATYERGERGERERESWWCGGDTLVFQPSPPPLLLYHFLQACAACLCART